MRVFVFRPQPEAERTARAVADHGFEPLVAPLFKVVRLPGAVPEGNFDAIVLTSGNAVPVLAEGPAAWRDLPVFTVGARTAAKVREAGLDDARSADGDRTDLIELIRRTLPTPAKLLMIVARDRKEDVSERLGQAGYEVALWMAYAAEPVSTLPEDAQAALRQGKADAALHYSARGARTFISLVQAAGVNDEAMELTHVALSADVAAPLIAAGASTVLVAEHPEEAGLLSALEQVSARSQAPGKAPSKPRGSLKRTPPTIELTAEPQPAGPEAPAMPTEAADTGTHPPEAIAPTEALPGHRIALAAPRFRGNPSFFAEHSHGLVRNQFRTPYLQSIAQIDIETSQRIPAFKTRVVCRPDVPFFNSDPPNSGVL